MAAPAVRTTSVWHQGQWRRVITLCKPGCRHARPEPWRLVFPSIGSSDDLPMDGRCGGAENGAQSPSPCSCRCTTRFPRRRTPPTPPTAGAPLEPAAARRQRASRCRDRRRRHRRLLGGAARCEAGARVVLVEANEIGWGASGRNAGHVPPGHQARSRRGAGALRRGGRPAGDRRRRAGARIPSPGRSPRHGIDCGFSRAWHHHGGTQRGGVQRAMARRVEYWQARGRPVELLDRRAGRRGDRQQLLSRCLDRPARRQVSIRWPMCAVWRAPQLKAGAALHEGTRATRLEA